jgi:hypothetical protein
MTDFLSRDDFSRLVQHQHENLKGLVLQPYANTLLAKLARSEIHFKHSEAD